MDEQFFKDIEFLVDDARCRAQCCPVGHVMPWGVDPTKTDARDKCGRGCTTPTERVCDAYARVRKVLDDRKK